MPDTDSTIRLVDPEGNDLGSITEDVARSFIRTHKARVSHDGTSRVLVTFQESTAERERVFDRNLAAACNRAVREIAFTNPSTGKGYSYFEFIPLDYANEAKVVAGHRVKSCGGYSAVS